MTEPIKISTKSSALTCDEYDQNLDILRDRANHVGTQSCNTINDLDSCLSTLDTIEDINTSINQNTTRIVNLENTLSASGSIAGDLNTLEASLRADIGQNNASIVNLETDLDNLTIRVSGVESNLSSVTNVVTLNNTTLTSNINAVINTNNAQNTRLTNVENRATNIATSVLTEASLRQVAINDLRASIDTEETNRLTEDSNLADLIYAEETVRINADNTLNTLILSKEASLQAKIDIEKNARIAADVGIQAQITTLTNSISNVLPTASVIAYLGDSNTIPTGYLLCAGAAISRATYSTLFSRLGVRFGVGNGSTTFNLPDFRDKIPYGSLGGTLASLASTIYDNTKEITVNNMPEHNHTVQLYEHTHSVNINHDHDLTIHPHTHTTGRIGSHMHSLAPYRQYSEGNGNRGNGAELTAVQPAGMSITIPNTAAADAAGPVVNPATVNIFPASNPGTQRTNEVAGTQTRLTTPNGSDLLTSNNKGANAPYDVRQQAIQVNFIIKT
jgi:microcystin-dependent protein